MKTKFTRTGITELTDNELILFDVMFDCSCPVKTLRKSKFIDFFNTDSHKLSDKKLKETLKKLNENKLIRLIENQDGLEKISSRNFKKVKTTFVELTAKGGKLWEKEREPIWEKYCEGWTYAPYKEENKLLLEAVSPSLETLKEYLKVATEINLFGIGKDYKIEFATEKRKFIVGLNWKRFPELHFATLTGNYEERIPTKKEWNYFYKHLNWWGNVHELNILKEQIS